MYSRFRSGEEKISAAEDSENDKNKMSFFGVVVWGKKAWTEEC